jgi:predicted kinase
LATAHLIVGLPGAGKTTYATALAASTGGVLFSLDRWLITLFGRYSLADVGQEEHTRRVLACRELIWSDASELLRRGADVVLDDGFFRHEHRAQCIAMAKAAGAAAQIHLVDTPLDVVRRRLTSRNANLPTHNFAIDPSLLTAFVGMFETPSDDEGVPILQVALTAPDRPR